MDGSAGSEMIFPQGMNVLFDVVDASEGGIMMGIPGRLHFCFLLYASLGEI